MTETQILSLTNDVDQGQKIKASRKQLAEAVRYWATRCVYETQARIKAERERDEQPKPSGLVLPNGFAVGLS